MPKGRNDTPVYSRNIRTFRMRNKGENMKIIALFIMIMTVPIATTVYAAAKDIRISDNDGDVLDISSTGTVVFSFTNDTSSGTTGAHDRRISDNDGEVLNINSDGSINITFNRP